MIDDAERQMQYPQQQQKGGQAAVPKQEISRSPPQQDTQDHGHARQEQKDPRHSGVQPLAQGSAVAP